MGCVGTIEQFNAARGLRCSVNPTCNLTDIRYLAPIRRKKSVCVLGGGPAGMEAAKVLAMRGHAVTLYEPGELGGMMNNAAFDPSFKDDITELIKYYKAQMSKLPIEIKREAATADGIIAQDYDAVIVATGSHAVSVKAKGEGSVRVHRTLEFTGNCDMELGKQVIVVGGCFFNTEIAYSLAKKGHEVTITSRRESIIKVGDDNSSPMQQRLMMLNAQLGVKTMTKLDWRGIDGDEAKFRNTETGEDVSIPCDDVILCRGFLSETSLFKELDGKVPELYIAGDATMKSRCVHHPVIGDAIEAGWVIGNRI